jgi:hypothetical protein
LGAAAYPSRRAADARVPQRHHRCADGVAGAGSSRKIPRACRAISSRSCSKHRIPRPGAA